MFDVQEPALEAQAFVMEVLQEVMKEVAMPEFMREMKKVWQTLPDEMKEQFKAERPQEYHMLMKEVVK